LHYAAALLVRRVPWIKSEDLPGGRVSLQETDIEGKESQLYGAAQDFVARSEEVKLTVEDPPDDSSSPMPFDVAPAAGGRVEGTEQAPPWWVG
jgi:hypothetical protein